MRSWRFRLDGETVLEVSAPQGVTERQVRRRGRVSLILGTLLTALLVVSIAYADDISNNLDATIDTTAETVNLTFPGATGTVGLYVVPQNGDGKQGCNLTGSTTLVVSVASSNSSVATVSPSSITFGSCGDTPSLTVTPQGAGTATVTLAQTSNSTAGTFNLAPATFTVNVSAAPPTDTTPPVISYLLSPAAPDGNNGWYVSDVTLTWTVIESESPGSLAKTGCVDQSITADQTSTTYSCSATSDGGSAGPVEVTIKRDATAPSVSGSAAPAANANGWNNTDVTVTFSGSDGLSGIDSCDAPVVLSSEGAGQSASGTCTDEAGNVSDPATVSGINIDKTAPTVALVGGPADGASYYFGFVPAAPTCTASDSLSGLDGTCSVSGYAGTVGVHTVVASALDQAGNQASDSRSYTVLAWTLDGFFQPVDMTMWNTAKAGSTIPLKFRVFAGPTELTDTSVVTSLKQQQVACTGGSEDSVEELAPTGGTTLRYDTTGGQFVYNWQTPKLPGKCYRVTVGTADGSSLVAGIKLK